MGANVNLLRVVPFSAASLLLLTIGCGSSPSTATTTPPPAAATTMYVMGANSILELPLNGQSSIAPIATLNLPAYTYINGFTIDPSGNIYVGANYSPPPPPNPSPITFEVLVYAAGATGAATPIRTITGFPSFVSSIAVDATGEIYAMGVFNASSIDIYAPTATGAAIPVRQIYGLYEGLGNTIDLDGADNIFLTGLSQGDTYVFSSSATGNASPIRIVIIGSQLYTAAVDTAGNLYAVVGDNSGNWDVYEYPPSANWLIKPSTPSRTITFTSPISPTSLLVPSGAAVDAVGNLYISMTNRNPPYQSAVYVFSPAESGASTPAQVITSTTGNPFSGIAVR